MSPIPPLVIPSFKSDVPESLLVGLNLRERYTFEQASITRQQNEWIMQQLLDGQNRFAENERRLTEIEATLRDLVNWRTILTSKGSLAGLVLSMFVLPILFMWLGAVFKHKLTGSP